MVCGLAESHILMLTLPYIWPEPRRNNLLEKCLGFNPRYNPDDNWEKPYMTYLWAKVNNTFWWPALLTRFLPNPLLLFFTRKHRFQAPLELTPCFCVTIAFHCFLSSNNLLHTTPNPRLPHNIIPTWYVTGNPTINQWSEAWQNPAENLLLGWLGPSKCLDD